MWQSTYLLRLVFSLFLDLTHLNISPIYDFNESCLFLFKRELSKTLLTWRKTFNGLAYFALWRNNGESARTLLYIDQSKISSNELSIKRIRSAWEQANWTKNKVEVWNSPLRVSQGNFDRFQKQRKKTETKCEFSEETILAHFQFLDLFFFISCRY